MSAQSAAPLPPHHVIRDFLPRSDHSALLALALGNQDDFAPTTVFRGSEQVVHDEQRTSRKARGGLGGLKEMFSHRIRAVSPLLFEKVGMRPAPIARLELELVMHGEGDHFSRHIDTITGKGAEDEAFDGTVRLLSAVYYFYREPKAFGGGALRLHRFGGAGGEGDYLDIEPEQNSLVAFPSFASHEVRRISCPSGRFEDSRFSVNCWLHRSL